MGRNHIYSMAHTSTPCGKGLQFLQDALQGSENRKLFFCFFSLCQNSEHTNSFPNSKNCIETILAFLDCRQERVTENGLLALCCLLECTESTASG